jgi:hypothetical protein
MIDRIKQKGYIVGLVLSYLFYEALKLSGKNDAWGQVWAIYKALFFVQLVIIFYLFKAFKKRPA